MWSDILGGVLKISMCYEIRVTVPKTCLVCLFTECCTRWFCKWLRGKLRWWSTNFTLQRQKRESDAAPLRLVTKQIYTTCRNIMKLHSVLLLRDRYWSRVPVRAVSHTDDVAAWLEPTQSLVRKRRLPLYKNPSVGHLQWWEMSSASWTLRKRPVCAFILLRCMIKCVLSH